jgi:hypothetical protein
MTSELMKRPPKWSFLANCYHGLRTPNRCLVTRQAGSRMEPLHWRLDLWDHSPSGLEWGYGGSGPAQLALALLSDALRDDDSAVALHQWFKHDVVSRLPHDAWIIRASDIDKWLEQHTEEIERIKEDKEQFDKLVLAEYDVHGQVEDLEGPRVEPRVDVVDDKGQVVFRDLPESYGLYVAAQQIGWMTVKRLSP